MAENENVVAETPVEAPVVETPVEKSVEPVSPEQPQEQGPSKGQRIKAALKEKLRKTIVTLKRKTQNIPFVVIFITSFVYLCCLNKISPYVQTDFGIKGLGIYTFVNTLASILVLLLFLYSFPKNKKINYIFVGITFAVLALMVVMDILFYTSVAARAKTSILGYDRFMKREGVPEAIASIVAHIVLLVISIVVFALLPVYKKLICKINTSKELASNDIKEEIDTSEEDG